MEIFASKTLPARMDSLMPLLGFVTSLTSAHGFDQKRVSEIELCLEEVLVNIFNYAYPQGPGDVVVTCGIREDGVFVIELADSGIPFDVLSVDNPNTSSSVDERHIGGLGIFFVKQLMDGVHYRRENGKNILTLSIIPASLKPLPL
ncbi:MAG: ATP-binding protein [Syntrophales bacterium]|nr:ATP-binding protein [Syntrophales bacterium]